MSSSKPRTPRKPAPLNSILEKELITYNAAAQLHPGKNFLAAAAIGALGLGAITLPDLASAEIVYTPTNQTFRPFSFLRIDLNNDGVADLALYPYSFFNQGSGYFEALSSLNAEALGGNQIQLDNRATNPRDRLRILAAADQTGQQIGPGQKFRPNALMASCFEEGGPNGSGSQRKSGWWMAAKNRYLGVKFSVNDEIHYGWVRVTVNNCGATGTVTGYAYETEPNQPITAGATESLDGRLHPQPSAGHGSQAASQPLAAGPVTSLGLLARGADGVAIWRRNEAAQ